MIEYQVFKVFLDYALLIIGLWAIAMIAVNAMFREQKSRPRLEPSKRQRKLYVHTIQPKGE